jgi:NAD(P)-dependent dehydrogenase (short-subunit alcohol dehydrogenase family)
VEQKEDDKDLALKGKRALVTESTTGIGEAIVRRLAAAVRRPGFIGRTARRRFFRSSLAASDFRSR